MLGYIATLPGRFVSFLNRNKYRIVGTAAVAGGVWFYYGDTIKQALELYRAIQQVQNVSETDASNLLPDETPKHPMDSSYRQTVSTGDETSQKQFQTIRLHLAELYSHEMEQIQNELKAGARPGTASPSQAGREELFKRLHALSYSRLLTALFQAHTLLLLARVEVCLIGRANRRNLDDDAKADHRELLSALRHVTSSESLSKVDKISRQIVESNLNSDNIIPTNIVKMNKLEPTLNRICDQMISNLRVGSTSSWDWLLGRLGQIPEEQSNVVKETLDVLESPQFTVVLTYLLKRAVARALSRSIPAGKENQSFPAAGLIPGLRLEPDMVTTINGLYLGLFKEAPIVDEFCQSVYLAEDGEDDSSINQDDLMMVSSDQEKLGQLLEKLVKADMSK
jgi:hypothetical protein